SRSSVKPRSRPSRGFWAPRCAAWPPSPTATVCVPRTSLQETACPVEAKTTPRPPAPAARRAKDRNIMRTTESRRSPRMTSVAHPELEGLGTYEYGWADSDDAGASARRGLNEDVVRDISARKDE